ncbi:unnamed protein product, partial [Scytosiphon promiscuus]
LRQRRDANGGRARCGRWFLDRRTIVLRKRSPLGGHEDRVPRYRNFIYGCNARPRSERSPKKLTTQAQNASSERKLGVPTLPAALRVPPTDLSCARVRVRVHAMP